MHTCDLAFTNCFVFFYQSMQITTNLQLEVKVFHKFLKYRFHGVPMKNSPNADRLGKTYSCLIFAMAFNAALIVANNICQIASGRHHVRKMH